jgi:hypothetical protein
MIAFDGTNGDRCHVRGSIGGHRRSKRSASCNAGIRRIRQASWCRVNVVLMTHRLAHRLCMPRPVSIPALTPNIHHMSDRL